jgi:hypothetical protein
MYNNKNTMKHQDKILTTFEEHLKQRYGLIGSERRADFEIKAKAFAIKEEYRLSRLPQQPVTINKHE